MVADHTSIEDRKLIHLVSEEFERQRLSVIKDPKGRVVDYLVVVSGAQSSSQITGAYPQTETQTTTVNNAWGLPVANAKTQSTTYVPYSYDYRVQKIYVTVYSPEDYLKNKRLLSVWEGYIGQGANKFSKHSRCTIKELVARLGLDYEKHTRIDSYCDATPRTSDE